MFGSNYYYLGLNSLPNVVHPLMLNIIYIYIYIYIKGHANGYLKDTF